MKRPVLLSGLVMLSGCATQGAVCDARLEPVNRPTSPSTLPLPVPAPASAPTPMPVPGANWPGMPDPASPTDATRTNL